MVFICFFLNYLFTFLKNCDIIPITEETKMNASNNSDTRLGYIKKPAHYVHDVHWATELHKHGFWEITVVKKGQSIHYVNGKQHVMNAGDILVMRPSDTHKYEITIGDDYTYLHTDIYATSFELKQVCDAIYPSCYDIMLNKLTADRITLNAETFRYIKSQITKLLYYQNFTDEIKTLSIYKPLLSSVVSAFVEEESLKSSEMPAWITNLIIKMNTPSSLSYTVDELAKSVNYSHSYVARTFKKYMNVTLIEYFTRLKIDYSVNLLKNTKLSMLDISSLLGYSSLSHFIRTFEKYYKCSPALYRKEMLNL